jgi:hypothetical protein
MVVGLKRKPDGQDTESTEALSTVPDLMADTTLENHGVVKSPKATFDKTMVVDMTISAINSDVESTEGAMDSTAEGSRATKKRKHEDDIGILLSVLFGQEKRLCYQRMCSRIWSAGSIHVNY